MQEDDRAYLQDLLEKYGQGEATAEEVNLLYAYYRSFDTREGITGKLDDKQKANLKSELYAAVQSRTRPVVRIRKLPRIWPYTAAVAVLTLVVGVWLLLDIRQQTTDNRLAATEILPGGNRATLTLADGRVINLDEAQTGIVIGDEDITYVDGTSLALSPAGEPVPTGREGRDGQGDGRGRLDEIQMLALTTPKGGTYQVTLPDGSKVWLNSASTLKYPSRFSGDSREVFLEGEAYFEIKKQRIKEQGRNVEAHDYAPFSVLTAGQVVEVLGTQFNISAYADEHETKTTLVEGKVKVTAGRQGGLSDYVLTAGQQATTRDAATTVNEVDVESYTSWKDGYFTLKGTIPEILTDISRWYDVEVAYTGQPSDSLRLVVTFPRERTLGDVLNALQAADPGLGYRLERSTIPGLANRNDTHTERRLTLFRKLD